MTTTAIRNAIRDAVFGLLAERNWSAIPKHARIDDAAMLPAAPSHRFTVQGPTSLTHGWVRLYIDGDVWVAPLLKGAVRVGQPYRAIR